jgi:transposase InsO family protein
MKFMFIQNYLSSGGSISLSHASQLLHVNRSGYYQWASQRGQQPSGSAQDLALRDKVQRIAVEFPRYGYRRITIELKRQGALVNHKKILRLMKEDNLLCVKKRFKPVTTDSNHGFSVYPNLIKDLEITQLNQVWASDITYIQLSHEFVYLSVILDLFSRRCIGWSLGRSLDTQLTLDALDMALQTRWNKDMAGLIHHSDQGIQYASHQYAEQLKTHHIQISMSRKGNPYDNAFVESFIKTLKWEEVYLNEYETYWDALDNIGTFIDDIYNGKRLHSSLEYRSPVEFEQEANLNNIT